MVSDFFIEAKVSRSGTGDKPRSTSEGQLLDRPLEENQKSILEGYEVHHVYQAHTIQARSPER